MNKYESIAVVAVCAFLAVVLSFGAQCTSETVKSNNRVKIAEIQYREQK